MSRLTGILSPDGYTVDYSNGNGLDSDISRLTSLSDDTGTLETFAWHLSKNKTALSCGVCSFGLKGRFIQPRP